MTTLVGIGARTKRLILQRDRAEVKEIEHARIWIGRVEWVLSMWIIQHLKQTACFSVRLLLEIGWKFSRVHRLFHKQSYSDLLRLEYLSIWEIHLAASQQAENYLSVF